MTALWVIPCKYDGRPLVQECVKAIREHHDDPHILVVDSASEDKSYFDDLDCIVADWENRNYPHGAYAKAYREFDYDHYWLWQDTLLVEQNLDEYVSDFTSVAWFRQSWGWNEDGTPLEEWAEPLMERHLGYGIPEQMSGVAGPAMCVSRRALDDLAPVFGILPETKWEMCAMERVWGIAAAAAGYDPRRSILGEMTGFWNFGPGPVRKLVGDRR